jgi:hypothetical protein
MHTARKYTAVHAVDTYLHVFLVHLRSCTVFTGRPVSRLLLLSQSYSAYMCACLHYPVCLAHIFRLLRMHRQAYVCVHVQQRLKRTWRGVPLHA